MGVDLGEKLSIEKRAVRVAIALGHAKVVAKAVKRLPHARQLAARQLQSVDDDEKKGIETTQRQFGVQEAQIEGGVMSHEPRAGYERNELLGALIEYRRRAKLLIGQPMNGYSPGLTHRPAGVEIRVPCGVCPSPFHPKAPHSQPRRSCGPREPRDQWSRYR
jgi:hypothetical protein